MVDLVLEEVREDAMEGVAFDAGSAGQSDRGVHLVVAQRFAQRDETTVRGVLLAG